MKIHVKSFVAVLQLSVILLGILPANIFAQEATRALTANAAADPVEIVLDYAKTVQIPTVPTIFDSIETDANTTVVGLYGIMPSGTHNNIVTAAPSVKCGSVGNTYTGKYGVFTRVTRDTGSGNVINYTPTKFMADLEKVYLVYKIIVSGAAKYLYVELRLVPSPNMYYETDFSASAFEKFSTNAGVYVDNDNAFYADFTNTDLDKKRYKKNVYGGKNYDLAENWNALPTDPDTYIDAYTTPAVESGELKVDFKDYSATRTFIWVQANGNLNEGFSLNFHPHESYVVQVRVRFHDLAAVSGKTPYMNLYYFTGPDRWEDVAEDYGDRYKEDLYRLKRHYALTAAEVAYLDKNEYVTITFPMGETEADTHTLMTNLRFQFGNVTNKVSSVMGGIAFDYVYVGPATSAPQRSAGYGEQTHLQDALYFDFDGTSEDLNRYGTHNYLSQNFDLASSWGTTTAKRIESVAVDEASSALVFTSKYDAENTE